MSHGGRPHRCGRVWGRQAPSERTIAYYRRRTTRHDDNDPRDRSAWACYWRDFLLARGWL